MPGLALISNDWLYCDGYGGTGIVPESINSDYGTSPDGGDDNTSYGDIFGGFWGRRWRWIWR